VVDTSRPVVPAPDNTTQLKAWPIPTTTIPTNRRRLSKTGTMFFSLSIWLVCIVCMFPSTEYVIDALSLPWTQPGSSTTVNGAEWVSSTGTSSSSTASSSLPPAFVIERLSTWNPTPTEKTFKNIANMCIPVFFDEQNNTNSGPGFVRQFKLNYLINLQAADLKVRRNWYPDTNEMFIAFEVVLANEDEYLFLGGGGGDDNDKSRTAWQRIRNRKTTKPSASTKKELKPLILDVDHIYNLSSLRQKQNEIQSQQQRISDAGDGSPTNSSKSLKIELLQRLSNDDDDNNSNTDNFVKGDILGFVEITQKPYGLGLGSEEEEEDDGGGGKGGVTPIRPVLTNLAVAERARKYGIGSKLVDRCEDHVRNVWKLNEMVLEVEDYNEAALQFYIKRGFRVMYSDPASRRYDLSGLFPEKVRCRREILRKVYGPTQSLLDSGSSLFKMEFFTRIQQLVGRT
jgi:ribosomal protein S18 acetylase RimI-like enzyme